MQKKIILRFATKCKRCGGSIPAGASAYWLGSGQGAQHTDCPTPSPQNEIQVPKATGNEPHRWTVDYADLRDAFQTVIASGAEKVMKVQRNVSKTEELKRYTWDSSGSGYGSDFVGCSLPEMQQWIAAGYQVEGLNGISGLVPARPRRKLRYSEEGDELLIDLVHAGDDNPFVDWEKRNSKPGLTVEINCTFNAWMDAKTITAFQRWVARALQTLDESGVDMEVNLLYPTKGLFVGYSTPAYAETMVRVRKPGEASDFANWSAMFSPGGFRMMGFTALVMHADKAGYEVDTGLGESVDYGEWVVAYDEERNRVVIGQHDKPGTVFPELKMTEQLVSVLNKLTGS